MMACSMHKATVDSCSTCFIWSRSGVGNSFNQTGTRRPMPMSTRVQCENGNYVTLFPLAEARAEQRGKALGSNHYNKGDDQ